MFKKGGFDAYDMESNLLNMIQDKLQNLTGLEVGQ